MVISHIGDLLRLPKSQRGVGRAEIGKFHNGETLDAKSRLIENGMMLKLPWDNFYK
jgi:hypothetical protein